MKMSTRGQYALEIAVDLALHLMPDRLESLNDIAKRRNLSEKYLERIMKLLKEAGLVKSVRGAYGGYCLMKEPGEISVLEVRIMKLLKKVGIRIKASQKSGILKRMSLQRI